MKNAIFQGFFRISLFLTVLATLLPGHDILAKGSHDISNVKFKIECSDTAYLKERSVNIRYILDFGDQFNPNYLELKISDFDSDCAKLLYVGKAISSSRSIISGKETLRHIVNWNVALRPVKEGLFVTPDVVLLYRNDTLDVSPKSKTIVIAEHTRPSGPDVDKSETSVKESDKEIIRLLTFLDKESVNLGDSVTMQIKLQSNQRISDGRFDSPLEIDDCYYESISMWSDEPIETTVDGIKCYEWTLLKYNLIPLKTGVIEIPEISMTLNISVPTADTDPFWGFPTGFDNVPIQVHSKEVKLKVTQP